MATRGYRQQTQPATTSAVAWTIDFMDDFLPLLVTLKFDSAPVSAGSITMKLDADAGADFDTVLASVDPVGSMSIAFQDLPGIQSGDKILVEYANPDSRSITGTCTADVDTVS